MTVSYANVNPGKMDLSPARITYKGVDLGGSLGNVTIKMKYDKANIMADQYGKSVLDRVVSGVEATVEFELNQITDNDTWKAVFPNAIKVTSGGNSQIVWQSKVGSHDLDLAGELIIHPLSFSDADLSSDFTFPIALAAEESQIVYGPTEQSKLKIIFNVYLDTSSNPAVLMRRGADIGIVDAVAGSPVFSGTGNGTMTLVSTGSGSVTETITAIVVGVPGSNKANFFVSGSITGSLGMAEIPGGAGSSVAFTSDVINFTLTDGSTDFVLNDNFTISVTGPNYV
jgi:hypothetical protein